jgi:hypothetical protein
MSQAQMIEQHHEIEHERVQVAGETKTGRSKDTNQKPSREEGATSSDLMSKGLSLLVVLLLMQLRVHPLRYSWDRLRNTRKEQPKEDIFCVRKLLRKEKKVRPNGADAASPGNAGQGSRS